GRVGEVSFAARSIKSQMRQAGRTGARVALLLGGDELAGGTVVIKDMDSGEQRSVPQGEAVAAV
ncbi:MAG TPA: histidine--tRNA ligase, partial [Desulfovibrio sp.]|nr:histidine--tRNA ligase [Desulfovibrio sp.]